MIEASPATAVRLSRATRVGLAAIGCGLLALLSIAACLEPDPSGQGTHQQLGLPPCTFYAWTEHRCPMCGMTTSWAHAGRGELAAAVEASASGTLAALAASLVAAWSLASAARGKAWIGWPSDWQLAVVGMIAAGVVLLEWVVRLIAGQ